MYSNTIIALLGFIGWALCLLLLMEVIRSWLVLTGQRAANDFTPDNANLSTFMQRLARAHANCVEGLPIFGGLLLVATLTGQSSVTDGTALIFLAARIGQSVIHLTSVTPSAVKARFLFFTVQLMFAVFWCWGLLMAMI
ncbi:MAPEG family protein [Marinicella sediminis]|uniref:MAPEG family protein n=1 Tax=Marinicella sediminis TaxID=1792834 RepID=A0ABV7J8X9_9GAMM|nr:MAPEG family protein [Marinicella sediminis]